MIWQRKHYREKNQAATFDCRHDSLYWFVVRSESMLVCPCGSIWWFRLPPTTLLSLYLWSLRSCQLSVLAGHLAGSNCKCTIHVILRLKCISQSAGNCNTVNRDTENKSSSLTQWTDLYWRTHKEGLLTFCYCVTGCLFFFFWMNCRCYTFAA